VNLRDTALMTPDDALTDEQRQRLAVLAGVQGVLAIELDAMDLVRCVHWVYTGQDL
jgi:hypothetical protein